MKTFVIGDTHGCFAEFNNLLAKTNIDLSRDRLILLGDYIDRGPDSLAMVQGIRRLQAWYGSERVVLLKGNHEQMAIDYYENGETLWFMNGGRATINDLDDGDADADEIIDFFKTLPLYYEDQHFIYVHAGLRPGISLDRQQPMDLLWIRSEFYGNSCDFGKTVIFGHTPTVYMVEKNYRAYTGNKIPLDTGCVFGGYLTALEIEDSRIVNVHQVPGLDYPRRRSA